MPEQDEPRAGYDGASLLEEIRLLVELLVERASPWLEGVLSSGHGPAEDRAAGDPAPAAHGAGGEDKAGGGWCPLCALVAVVRGERPEFAARLLEQAAQLVALLRAVLADRWEPEDGVHMPGFHPAAKPTARQDDPGPGRVQHIAVRQSADWRQEPGN